MFPIILFESNKIPQIAGQHHVKGHIKKKFPYQEKVFLCFKIFHVFSQIFFNFFTLLGNDRNCIVLSWRSLQNLYLICKWSGRSRLDEIMLFMTPLISWFLQKSFFSLSSHSPTIWLYSLSESWLIFGSSSFSESRKQISLSW